MPLLQQLVLLGRLPTGPAKLMAVKGWYKCATQENKCFGQCVSDSVSCDAMFIFDFHFKPAETHQIGHTSTGHSMEKRLDCALKGS